MSHYLNTHLVCSAEGYTSSASPISIFSNLAPAPQQSVDQSFQLLTQDEHAYDEYFAEVLLAHKAMIARVVSSYERSKSLQEELYQEISVALWKALKRFDQQSSLKTYILSIAHKRAVSHVARCVKEPYQIEIETIDVKGDACPSEHLANDQTMQRMLNAIYQLPLVERQLVTLALEGESYKDIATILGLSVTNVGAKLNRSKAKLTELMHSGVPT